MQIFTKFTLSRQFYREKLTEFHENPTHSLVADITSPADRRTDNISSQCIISLLFNNVSVPRLHNLTTKWTLPMIQRH